MREHFIYRWHLLQKRDHFIVVTMSLWARTHEQLLQRL